MGGNNTMKWNKFTGTITHGNVIGKVELVEGSDPPAWFSCVQEPEKGWQVSKNFKEGDLEKAYNWCVSTIEKT